jgi:hypothetical protein
MYGDIVTIQTFTRKEETLLHPPLQTKVFLSHGTKSVKSAAFNAEICRSVWLGWVQNQL